MGENEGMRGGTVMIEVGTIEATHGQTKRMYQLFTSQSSQ